MSQFASGADFATALRPLIGTTGATLFALGIVEAGLVAAMTISTSSSYSLAETVGGRRSRHSLNLDFAHGRLFYGVAIASTLLAAGIVLIPGAPLLAMTLTVNVIATLLMAPALLLLLLLANDREIMRRFGEWLAGQSGRGNDRRRDRPGRRALRRDHGLPEPVGQVGGIPCHTIPR